MSNPAQTAEDQTPTPPVSWYRTPLPSPILRGLCERSDLLGWLQSLLFLGVLALTSASVFVAEKHASAGVVLLLIFVNGTAYSFAANGAHELCHGTVFRAKRLNALFVRILAFLNWLNFEIFQISHAQHHRYTLHPPEDLEVVLPMRLMIRNFLLEGFVNPIGAWKTLRATVRIARGKFVTKWELLLFPESQPEKRRPAIMWARTLLIGHGAILAVAIIFKLWLLPVIVTLAPFYGGWLFFLCNNTQHIGLQDNVSDFRLCSRTVVLNPFLSFMYWRMNYHIEHHMYAAVPCYRLGRLHKLIEHDLPPCPHGLIATWRQIAAIQRMQDENPSFQYIAPLPHP